MSTSTSSEADPIALIAESRRDQIIAAKELEGLRARQQVEAKELKARQSELGERVDHCRKVLAESKGKISSRFEPAQVAYLRAVEKAAMSPRPLGDVEIEAKKLQSQQVELLDLIAKRNSARDRLGSLLNSSDEARRKAWDSAAGNDSSLELWGVFCYLVLPVVFGLISGGLWVFLSFIVGAVATWTIVWSHSTLPAKMLGRSEQAGDSVELTQGDRFTVLVRGWAALLLVAPLVTILVSLFMGG